MCQFCTTNFSNSNNTAFCLTLQFNAGSALGSGSLAAQAFLTTNTATATALVAWLLMDQLRGLKMRTSGMCMGAVVGLVAITPAAGVCAVH
jgi:Amt family ammonium transporter